MLESYKWIGYGMGLGWKSLQALILRAPLCGANKLQRNQSDDNFYISAADELISKVMCKKCKENWLDEKMRKQAEIEKSAAIGI